jgi:Cyclin
LIIETIWPNQTIPILNSKILPLRVFIQETIRRSRTSFSTLQLALYYLLRIKSAVLDFEKKNPNCFNGPCDFGRTASKHPITCGRRMFLAAVIVASKYLQDRNYSNRAWAKISGLPVKEINANEFVFLNVAKYDLYVGDTLYKRWSGVLLNHVMATVSVSTAAATHISGGLATPPLTPVISPTLPSHTTPTLPPPKALRMALAQRFCDAIRGLSPLLTETELSSLHVLGFQSLQQKPMSPPPTRNGLGQTVRPPNSPPFPLNPLLSQSRLPSFETSPQSSTSDSASDSEVWSPRSNVSSVSSNDSTNISPRTNLGRSYLKSLGCSKTIAAKPQCLVPSCLSKRCASPLSIIAACNDRKRIPSISDSPATMDEVRPTSTSTAEEEQEWSSNAGTIDPKLLQLNSSALTAVKGLCSLSQRATVFQPPPSSSVHGGKRTFGKSYSMGHVQSDYEPAKRRRGALSDQTLARML